VGKRTPRLDQPAQPEEEGAGILWVPYDPMSAMTSAIRLRPLDLGWRPRVLKMLIGINDSTHVQYITRSGKPAVAEGSPSEIAKQLRRHGYRVRIFGPDETL
jgi:hypothetical protein